jgi:hypothetical protein
MTAKKPEPSLMRNLGAFFGHIVHAIKEDPSNDRNETAAASASREARAAQTSGSAERETHAATGESDMPIDALEVRREIQEARHGPYILRRTTIDEVIRPPEGAADEQQDHTTRSDARSRDGSEGSHASH